MSRAEPNGSNATSGLQVPEPKININRKELLKMTEDMKREKLQEIIDNADENDIITWWNDHCDCDTDCIYYMDELDGYFDGRNCKSPTDIIDSLDSDFSTSDYYFTEGDYGLKSFDDIYDVVDDDDLIDYMLEADEDFGNDDIRDILDEETDEEE